MPHLTHNRSLWRAALQSVNHIYAENYTHNNQDKIHIRLTINKNAQTHKQICTDGALRNQLCECGQWQTMNRTITMCPLAKYEGRLQFYNCSLLHNVKNDILNLQK